MTTPASILKSAFGYDRFRPGQDDVINQIMSGKNVLAVMPTGAGKSLCYQVPALLFERVSVVISPLVALMDNQVAGLRANGLTVACIHSGQSRSVNVEQWRDVASGRAKLLYLSPERLMTPRMIAAMKSLSPAMFVIDEAHCVSKWGPAFRPEYAQLSVLKTEFPDAVIAAFTATADEATRGDIAQTLFSGQGQILVQGFDRPNLSLAINIKTDRKAQLTQFMDGVRGQSGIVYALSRKNTEEFAAQLRDAGHKALPYHAGLDAKLRFDTQERFMAEEGMVIVATIAFGMGIDKPDIRFVYHTNLPGSLEAYYQEIGRAGRDGAPAVTALCYGLDDVRMRRQFIMNDGAGDSHQVRELRRLDALLSYCEASTCRRQVMLAYFGEEATPCKNCDNCENPPEMIDATAPLQAILNSIEETGARFGQAHIVAVARGADTQRIRQFGHENTAAYGGAKSLGAPYLQGLIRQALASGHIGMDIERFGALTITELGRDVLRGHQRFQCKDIILTKAGKSAPRKRANSNKAQSELSKQNQGLLSELKIKRTEIARGIGKPAYIVFSDATLIDMVRKRPENKDAMLDVSGVGAVKYERFGEAFLSVIRNSAAEPSI